MPKNVDVNVLQKDGEISISIAGDEPTVYKVTAGAVSVPEESVARFLAAVDGSKVAEPSAIAKG